MTLMIFTIIFLFSIAQANNPFEGGFVRLKCQKGRRLTGCKETLLDAYKRTNLSKSDQNINEADTYMMLFTRKNKNNPEYLDECGGSLPQNTYFNKENNLVIIIHGYRHSVCGVAWMREMMIQLLFRDNYNVILIDYSWGNQVDYFDAVRNIRVVAKQVAFLIQNIVENTGMETDKMHLIGHSLGAHTVGMVGYWVQKLLDGKKVRRLTGLDPAGPGFVNASKDVMLDETDAIYVDAIHSNAGGCHPLFLGYEDQVGHADFYPNGGTIQLSCISLILPSLMKGDMTYAIDSLLFPACNHQQSIQYFKMSINSCDCQYIGVGCDNKEKFKSGECKSCGSNGSNCAVMGMDWEYYPHSKESTKYFLSTSMSCPYCDNKGINLGGFPLLPPGKEKPKCFSTKSDSLSIIG